MLRNRGVNVTERRIKQDVLRAYEYDIFDVRPRWRCLHEAGCQTNVYRQPRYCTVPRPVYYQTGRSSLSSVGVKRVYLPDDQWGDSADSTLYVRNNYNMGSYYPNEAFITGDRYRRDFRYPDGYYSKRPSTMYIDENDYYPTRSCSRYATRKLTRTVTRKLSPIFPCECTTKSYMAQRRNNTEDTEKQNNLSKEAKKLSLDVYKILSLLSKADDEDHFSSVSMLQNIHNLDCQSNNSVAQQLITQRVDICSKMEKRKQYHPLPNLKTTSKVRNKLEILVRALKEYEAEQALDDGSFDYDNMPDYNDVIPSDPPSLEVRSFLDGKDVHSSTNFIGRGKRKNIVLQTEEPKTSNKSVCGKVKLKKGDSNADRKSLRSRLSWRKKESSGIKMRRDSAREKLVDKKTERKGSFFYKTKSKEILESELKLSQAQKSDGAKQEKPNNKAGLMITIGGSPQRKKQPPKATTEKHKEKMPKTWIRRFLEDKRESKNNNIRIRWNNRAFYAKSSSTVFDIVNNVYKQMGINRQSKSDQITTSKNKKALKKTTYKQSKTNVPKSSKKGKYRQKVDAYMMPEIIVPGPVFTPDTKGYTKRHTQQFESNLPRDSKPYLNAITTKYFNGASNASDLSSYFFEIKLPKTFLDPVLTSKVSSSDERVEEVDEYIYIQSDSSAKTQMDDLSGMSGDEKEDFNDSISFNGHEGATLKTVIQMEGGEMDDNLCLPKTYENTEASLREPEFERNKSIEEEMQQSYRKSHCSLAEQFIQEEYRNWMPLSKDSLQWSPDCEDSVKIIDLHDEEVSMTNTDNTIITTNEDITEHHITHKAAPKNSKVYRRRTFRESLIRWKDRTKGTLSESIVGINAKTPVVSVLWRLFGMLRRDYSVKTNLKTPPQDLSLVEPPGTVSVPECSYKSQTPPQKPPQSQETLFKYEPLKLTLLASNALQTEKEVTAKIDISSTLQSVVYKEFANLAHDVLVEEQRMVLEQLSLTESPAQTIEEAENTSRLCEPIELITYAELDQVLEKSQEEVDLNKASLWPLRLVRSFHFNMSSEKIIPRAVRSVLLPQQQQQIYHLQMLSQFVLSVHKGYNAQESVQQALNVNLQPLDETQLMPVAFTSYLEDKIRQKYANRNQGVEEIPKDNKVNLEISMQEEESVKVRECQEKKSLDNKTNNAKQFTYIQQVLKTESNILPPKHSQIDIETDAPRLNLEVVEVIQKDKITKIFIKNRSSMKVNKQKVNNVAFQESVVNNVELTIKQPEKRKQKKNIKLCINYAYINTKKTKRSDRLITDVFKNQLPEKDVDNTQVGSTDLEPSENPESVQLCSFHGSLRQDTLVKPCTRIDDICGDNMPSVRFIKPASRCSISATELNDSVAIDKVTSIDSCLYSIETDDFANKILGTPDKINHNDFKHVVEMNRLLTGMMTLNVNAFIDMALLREFAKENNKPYSSIGKQLERCKKIVNIQSEINTRNCLRDQETTAGVIYGEPYVECCECPLCIILGKKLDNRHVDTGNPSRIHSEIKEDCNSNVSHLTKHTLHTFETKDEFNNHDIFVSKDDKEIEAIIIKSLPQSSKRKTKKTQDVKSVNKEKLPSNNLTNQRIIKTHYYDPTPGKYKGYSTSDDMDPCGTPYTELKVLFKNQSPQNVKKTTLYSEVNKSDVLQSCNIKKAVLEIYRDRTVEHEDFVVAKVPKYLHL